MSYAGLAYTEYVLEDRWTADVSGRIQSVPQPRIEVSANIGQARLNNFQGDIIYIRDGGTQNITPSGMGHSHRDVETPVTIDIRTTGGRKRLEGVRDDNNESESYGGLRGEVLRIIDEVRRGDKEYAMIEPVEWRDVSEDVGYQFWRGIWEVNLDILGQHIEP